MKVQIKYPEAKCKWCGEPFTKQHNRQVYCSKTCADEAEKENNRNRRHKWYHKNKHRLTQKQRYGLGSGTLGPHKHQDNEKELQTIKNERKRIGI